MTTRDIFEAYFKNGDEFLYVLHGVVPQHFKIDDIQHNDTEMIVRRISPPNQQLEYFCKVRYDVPYIYKVIQNFKR